MSDSNTIPLDPNAPDDPGDSMQGRQIYIAIVRTMWEERQGGYWEAQAYDTDLNRIRGMHATMVDERAAVGVLAGKLIADGCHTIVCDSSESIHLTWRYRHGAIGWDAS